MTPIASTPFVRTLALRDELSAEDMAALELLTGRPRSFAAGEELVAQGARLRESCLVLSGFVARGHYLENGRRQFSAIHVPGDFVDLHSLLLKVMDHSVIALTPCAAAFFTHQNLKEAGLRAPHLERLLWMLTVIDAAVHRAWIVSFGSRSAEARVAHFFCELFVRLRAVGLVHEDRFEFPVRQADLADMLGFSLVHLNRSVQGLRRRGLIEWRGSAVRIPDVTALVAFAEFNPAYLSLEKEPR
jgi:CRP-like cAMP-binding protein